MTEPDLREHTIGWIGTGRMGFAMAKRLIEAGCDVSVYNRTRSKAEPLAGLGARVVDAPQDLCDRDIVFTMVSGPDDLIAVACGKKGFLTGAQTPKLLIDSSSVSAEASGVVRKAALEKGADMLAAPVSGNAKVVKGGKLTIVVSGPRNAFETAGPYLEQLGRGVTYVGKGELARMVKGSPKTFDTRIILFSCNSDPEFRKRAIELGAVDFLSKTEGYPSIVKRVSEVAPVAEETQAGAETVVRDQLHSLALSLVDMLHMAGSPSALPEPTRYALDSARRIADDIERLTGTGGEATESEEETAQPAESRS